MKHILITTGDFDGIGLEVACKALQSLGPQKNVRFFLFCHSRGELNYLQLLSKFNTRTCNSFAEAKTQIAELIIIQSHLEPAHVVELCAKICADDPYDFSLCTGPLSKPQVQSAGLKDIGHTDILKRITNSKELFMTFLGNKFNVALLTGHIPIKNVSQEINASRIISLLKLLQPLCEKIKLQTLPIAVLGLNPHAGDQGIIGDDEAEIQRAMQLSSTNCVGPLVPDAAFLEENYGKYSFYIALYHDQGLIPFKAIHGFDSGVHMTLGLPFVRTSVDHGTAKNIFGKNIANYHSMLEAIKYAIQLQ